MLTLRASPFSAAQDACRRRFQNNGIIRDQDALILQERMFDEAVDESMLPASYFEAPKNKRGVFDDVVKPKSSTKAMVLALRSNLGNIANKLAKANNGTDFTYSPVRDLARIRTRQNNASFSHPQPTRILLGTPNPASASL